MSKVILILPQYALPAWVTWLQGRYVILGPQVSATGLSIGRISDPQALRLDASAAWIAWLAHSEPMPPDDRRPVAAFGIPTCELHGLRHKARQRPWARREDWTLVSVECLAPCAENAVCRQRETWCMPDSYDIHLLDLGSVYGVEVGSPAGMALVGDFNRFRPARSSDYEHIGRLLRQKLHTFPNVEKA